MVVGQSTPKDEARAAFGDRARSAAIHIRNEWVASNSGVPAAGQDLQNQQSTSSSSSPKPPLQAAESYNEESRVHSTMMNRSLIFAGLHGCGVAATILSITRVLSRHHSSGVHSLELDRIRHVLVPIVAATAIPSSITLGYLIYSSMECERFFENRERARELWEMQSFPEGEYSEMVNIYQSRGLSQKDAETVVSIFARDETVFLDLMMVEELGYSRFGMPGRWETFIRACIPAVFSHAVCIVLPLIPQLWLLLRSTKSGKAPPLSWCAATRMSDVLVVAQALGLSVLQTLLLHGAYANLKDAVPVVMGNVAWISSLYSGVHLAAKGLLRFSQSLN